MNISKRKQGILAIICTIAMIVTSITVYNPREVKAGQSDAASYDYSSTEWLGDGAGGGKYNNKYKLALICPLSSRQVKYLKISTDYTYILIEM